VPSFHGRATSYGRSRQSSGRHSIGVKSRWAMYSGRLKRRMWLETAQRLKYTLTRFHGDRFEVEAWTRQEWNMIIEPAVPAGSSGGPASDNGRLRHVEEAHGRADRRRRVFEGSTTPFPRRSHIAAIN
jgi:hypothetical protein